MQDASSDYFSGFKLEASPSQLSEQGFSVETETPVIVFLTPSWSASRLFRSKMPLLPDQTRFRPILDFKHIVSWQMSLKKVKTLIRATSPIYAKSTRGN